MNTQPKWQYDEMNQCGIDFADPKEVISYEENHSRLTDFKKLTDDIIDKLGIKSDQTVIDAGCGTGGFTVNAAGKCRQVTAIDVSQPMLDFCRAKAEKAGFNNIEYIRAGFLTYEHKTDPADAVVCRMALHHLPDFWKLIGLKNIAASLKPGGKLYLFDVVFSFDIDYENAIEGWIKKTTETGGEVFKKKIETHIREEYSIFDWIMEGLLERAGFKIDSIEYKDGFFAEYICTKI